MIRIEQEAWKTKARGIVPVIVKAEDSKGQVVIELEGRWTVIPKEVRAEVCWKAVGPVSSTIAREFAQAILTAADLADAAAVGGPEAIEP